MRIPPSVVLPIAAAILLAVAGCPRATPGFDPAARGPEFDAAALEVLQSDEPHELFSRLDFWAEEAQAASALWGRAFSLCSQRSEKPRPNCAPVLMHATALQSAFLHGFMKELQAQAPGMPAPPMPPPMPGALMAEPTATATPQPGDVR